MAKLLIRRSNLSKNKVLFVKETFAQIESQKNRHLDVFHFHDLNGTAFNLPRSCVLTISDFLA